MAKAKLYGDWAKADRRLKGLRRLMRANVSVALRFSSKDLVKEMKKKIRKGDLGWEPLAPITVQRKGHGSPLQDTGSLRDSLVAKRVNQLKYEAGIPKGAKNKANVSLVMIGAVQEFGKVIRPKKAKMLTIPITRQAAALAITYGSVRSIPGVFRLKGTRVLAMKGPQGVVPVFILMDKVKIPPRSFIASTFNKEKKTIQNRFKLARTYALEGKRYIR